MAIDTNEDKSDVKDTPFCDQHVGGGVTAIHAIGHLASLCLKNVWPYNFARSFGYMIYVHLRDKFNASL